MRLRASRLLTIPIACLAGCYQGVGAHLEGATAGDDPASAEDETGGGGDDGVEPLCNGQPAVSPRPMRRLNPSEYQSTMRDLLGDPGFVAEYDGLESTITERAVRQLRNGAETALARRDQWNEAVFACELAGPVDDACADDLIERFGARAFRRPLHDGERAWLRSVYEEARDELGFADAMEIVTQTILQAPAFLYLEEVGELVDGAPSEIRRLTDYEVANRLSYFLWGTMPDEALFQAAADGRLAASEGLAEEVDRMLDDPRAEGVAERFVWNWLHLDGGPVHFALEDATKDPELYPEFGPMLVDGMRTELEALVSAVFHEDGTLEDLFTTNRAYVNQAMAELYGVEGSGAPLDDDSWGWVDLDPTRRSGLLTRAGFLTVYAANRAQAPIRRGVAVLENVMCGHLGAPPPDVDDTPPQGSSDPDDPRTVRQDVEARTSDNACTGCHNLINPIGFAFEHYDAIGRWQDVEVVSGLPVDARTTIPVHQIGEVAGAIELGAWLGRSELVASCFAGAWLATALGGELGAADACEQARIVESFAEGGTLRSLVQDIVASAPFRFINTSNEEG